MGRTAPGRYAEPPFAPHAALRWHIARRLIVAQRPASIVELGCGLGAVGTRLVRMARYCAAEPDERSFAVAHRRIAPLGGTGHPRRRSTPATGKSSAKPTSEVTITMATVSSLGKPWVASTVAAATFRCEVPSPSTVRTVRSRPPSR